jgi:hypothetical protein
MPSGDAWQEVKVIINDAIGNGYTGHINDPGHGHTKEHDEAKHPFFIMNGPLYFRQNLLVERKGRNDDNGTRGKLIRENLFILYGEIFL